MIKIEMKICSECKAKYFYTRGGIITSPREYMDMGLCEKCRIKKKMKMLENFLCG